MSSSTAELLAAVEQSPRAIAEHDRSGWVELFTEDGRVEDPVGSRPYVGHQQIGRFYDTFVAPRVVVFHRDHDIVRDESVVRDVTLEVDMGPGVQMMIPAFLRYDMRQTEKGWQITRLRAYWELPTMVGQFLRSGIMSVPASLRLSAALLRNQRLGGTVGFLSGFRSPGRRGKQIVEQALVSGQLDGVRKTAWHKVIAAGNEVAAAVVISSGRGVMFVDLDDRGQRICNVDIFSD